MLRKIALVMAAAMVLGLASNDWASAQGGRGGRGPGGFGGGSPVMMLGSPQVREVLELTEEQTERLDDLQQEMQDSMRDIFSGMRDMAPEERQTAMAEMREKMQEATTRIEKDLDTILLDHQQKKLAGIFAKSSAQRGGGLAGVLSNPQIAKRLGISESEMTTIKEKVEDLQKKQEEEIAKVREKYDAKLIAMLPKEAQATVKEWMETEVPEMDWGGGRGGRGGNGGRGRGGNGGGNGNRPQDF